MNKKLLIITFLLISSSLLAMENNSASPKPVVDALVMTHLSHPSVLDERMQGIMQQFMCTQELGISSISVPTSQLRDGKIYSASLPQGLIIFMCDLPPCNKTFTHEKMWINHIINQHPEYNTLISKYVHAGQL